MAQLEFSTQMDLFSGDGLEPLESQSQNTSQSLSEFEFDDCDGMLDITIWNSPDALLGVKASLRNSLLHDHDCPAKTKSALRLVSKRLNELAH